MTYTAYDNTNPDSTATGGMPVYSQSIRDNFQAMRDAVIMGAMAGWNMTPSGGTAEQPATLTYSKGVERIKATLTWGTTGGADGNVTQSVYSYSSNGGTSWDVIGTMTVSYDASSNVTGTAWS